MKLTEGKTRGVRKGLGNSPTPPPPPAPQPQRKMSKPLTHVQRLKNKINRLEMKIHQQDSYIRFLESELRDNRE